MTRYRALLLAILVYLALDLALPGMPGAFVFDPADSVESVRTTRGRAMMEILVAPEPDRVCAVPCAPDLESRKRVARIDRVERRSPSPVTWRPRVLSAPAPPSEDPH